MLADFTGVIQKGTRDDALTMMPMPFVGALGGKERGKAGQGYPASRAANPIPRAH